MGPVEGVGPRRSVAHRGRRDHGGDAFKAVLDGELSGHPLIYVAESWPLAGGGKVIGHHLLEQPRGSAKRKVEAQGNLKEVNGRAVELLYKAERVYADDLDLSVQPQ